jgi:phage gp29-like protein
MALQQLNIGELTPAALAQLRPAPATGQPYTAAELGVSGTPIFGGFLRELGEYNPELQGFDAYRVYERMRRGDGQVAATLQAIKLPIRSAEWTVQEPKDASPIEKEATEFVRSCFFEELDFDSIIRNALLMLDFGAAVHENIWYLDGQSVRIRKLAPRLPLTFYRWLCAPDSSDLASLEQLGYGGDVYKTTQIPVDKMALFTFNQEGDNFTGMSLLRPMYQHWYIKSNLYKIEAISAERNGMGVPIVTMGAAAKQEDRTAATDWVTGVATNQSTGLVLPPEWTFEIKGVQGMIHDAQKAIAHHNDQISMCGLAQFMNLGQGEKGGSRALGTTMSDFFYLGLQAAANHIGRVTSLQTIKPLVDLNFPGVVNYPKLKPQQILSIKLESVVDALSKLGSPGVDMVRDDDELEAYLRDRMGLPVAGKPRAPIPAPPSSGGGSATPPNGAGFSERTEGERFNDAFKGKRQPVGAEKCVAFSEINSALDKGRDDIAAALRKAKPRIQAEVVHKLMARPVKDAHRVSVELDQQLVDEVYSILEGVQTYGHQTVSDERNRQGKPGDAKTIRASATAKDKLGLYADGVVSEFTNNLQQRGANVVIDAKRKATPTGQAIIDAGATLDDQSDGWIDNVASKGANEAFADGRSEGYDQYADEISSVIYSAMLDLNSCDPCCDADGTEGDTPDDIADVPNPDCDGGDKCRCVHVFVFADEGSKK